MKRWFLSAMIVGLLFMHFQLSGQFNGLIFNKPGSLTVNGVKTQSHTEINLQYGVPLFSLRIDSILYNSANAKTINTGIGIHFIIDSIETVCTSDSLFRPGAKYMVRFINRGKGIHKIENLVPFGEGSDKVFITAQGSKEWPQYLCRSVLCRPGSGPVGVVLPDNAWHLGFADLKVNDTLYLAALARRGGRDKEKSNTDRWATTLKPGGWIEYIIWCDIHKENWQAGLRMMFHDRWLYDLPSFDNTLFERKDLGWMKNKYLMLLQFAWDKEYFDPANQSHSFYKSFSQYDSLTSGWDIFTLWPTWPRMGLDQRNQWDMYRDLPGGLDELHNEADFLHKTGRHFFISYNPWDESTRKEDQMNGMEDLLKATDADGVVLDTRGSSSKELQATADKVKPGIIMYSEGMAIPKDMPGIVAGRVHDALVLPPPLNLNKLIKPDFAIFRVLQLADDRLHREIAISFFNGYGVEINTMRPGRPYWIKDEFTYLGKCLRILRENNFVFHNDDWFPLVPALTDSIYINRWVGKDKTVYTIYSVNPSGNKASLFEVPSPAAGTHYVDLWNHKTVKPVMMSRKWFLPVVIDPFDPTYLNTRQEGNAGCVALFPELLNTKLKDDSLVIDVEVGERIVVTSENPTYRSKSLTFQAKKMSLRYHDYFPVNAEKLVIQLFNGTELTDENVIPLDNSLPVFVSAKSSSSLNKRSGILITPGSKVEGMKEIPSGNFRYYTLRDPSSQEPFIRLPDHSDTTIIFMMGCYMDVTPVTNMNYMDFIKKSHYRPQDTSCYLKHWDHGRIPAGQEDYPVVFVSLDDARAYAQWAGKRLPSGAEWQYAAQGTDMRKYPWGMKMDSTKCNFNLNHPTPVNAFPDGASPYGILDLIGNVWQMTGDVYEVGSYTYNMIRGGSYYHPASSIWYVTGGPLPADHPEMLLQISPGLNRNATVGFRCVMDVK